MSTHTEPHDGINFELPQTAVGDATSRDELLDDLLVYLDGLEDVTATEVDTHSCGRPGCSRDDCRHWRVDIEGGRRRTLCPAHAVDFTRKESDCDV